ncbi:acetyl-CoA hydrolase/transferase C-terminal domain-containing protein, partial [Limnobacter sp.]|uniref:acetyl-CoA hydrolase/transferase C-terminal domain-containing protein n=1 Tax=Limnobacter sp. TaxID=2003368 RepID=UPI002582B4DB
FNYGHCTIPRHLRDIVITEYGIADLRSKTDNEIAKALINIADSRFQEMLLVQAQAAGKIEPGYQVPAEFRNNLPDVFQARLLQGVDHAVLPQFPFGTDFTQQEQRLMDALLLVKEAAAIKSPLRLAFDTLFEGGDEPSLSAQILDDLKRVKLDAPSTFKEKVTRHLLIKALKEVYADA